MDDKQQFSKESSEQNEKSLDSQELFQQLAAEEPPVLADGTAPSVSSTAPRARREDGWQQYIGSMMLLAALIFTTAAGLVIFFDQGDESGDDSRNSDAAGNVDKPTVPPVSTQQATQQPTLETILESQNVAFLPTAAVDEAAIALLTPVPQAINPGAAVQRANLPFTEISSGGGGGFARYVVQTGDTLDGIREKYELGDVCTIVWSNDRRKVSPLRPGNELVIPPIDGYYAKIREPITIGELAEDTGVTPLEIIESPYNPDLEGSTAETLLIEGMQIMVPGGTGGNCNVWEAKPVPSGGDGDVVDSIRYYSLWGCEAEITGGGFPVQAPINNGQFFQGFSAYHTGVDLSAPIGTPIFA
ncbi:MAG: hypothetical protein GYB66_04530, partial [Chloroflexi bacterium]|nr:hypothetical protein [Chloroflexota bacterium]